MLTELKPLRYTFDFGSAKLCLRYDMAALLKLEETGLKYDDIFAQTPDIRVISEFAAAGMADIPREKALDILAAVGALPMAVHCREAMLLSLPADDPYIVPPKKEEVSTYDDGRSCFERLFTMVVDVMRKSEDFYWHSTPRELMARWEAYAIAKGYMKPPERVQMYDTEE